MKRLWTILLLLFLFSCEDKEKEEEEKVYTPTGRIILQSTYVGKETLIVVDAQDEMGIDKVEFFIDDDLRLTDNAEPYEYLWKSIKDLEGKHKIRATTYNLQGNSISDSVEVTVTITNIIIPQDFSTIANDSIKEYLDAGDTITVNAGTYTVKNLNFTNYDSLFIIGIGGARNVILDGDVKGRVIAISKSTLQGFTIQHGLASDNGGGGVLIYGGTVRNCIISNNETTWNQYSRGGGGIQCIYDCVIENNLIYGNTSEYVGGGVHISENSTCDLVNNVILGNQVRQGYGGGVYIHKANSTILNNIFHQNLVSPLSGGTDLSNLVSHNNNDFGKADYNVGITDGNSGVGNLGMIDPKFLNENLGNFQLQSDSPCIDKGHPDAQYNDIDGTRNDMGAYGGKYGEWNN
ncbi:MAG: hypothetical protein HOK52_01750 [Candidatus Marinimicrobia bacterium]|jgi:hypothetical protein|nr:hypothetical protein [Candidatus Neomarinimicrobiota bacterium]